MKPQMTSASTMAARRDAPVAHHRAPRYRPRTRSSHTYGMPLASSMKVLSAHPRRTAR